MKSLKQSPTLFFLMKFLIRYLVSRMKSIQKSQLSISEKKRRTLTILIFETIIDILRESFKSITERNITAMYLKSQKEN